MKRLNSLFFSKLPSRRVFDLKGNFIGKIKDVVCSPLEENQKITALKLSHKKRTYFLKWNSIDIYEIGMNKIAVKCSEVQEYIPGPAEIMLYKYLLDKQIVDINDRKVVRVNDARLAEINGEMKLIAVDIGFTGLLRRLGIESIVKGFFSLFNYNFNDELISWDNVEPIDTGASNIKLAVPYKKLQKLHPADLADIIEDLDVKYRNAVFQSLDDEKAADILEEIEPEVQISIIDNLSEERAADILENMDADEAADILEELPEEQAEILLSHMETEDSEEIRELMDYEEKTVGSLMTTEFISFQPDRTVEDTINELRRMKPSPETVYYLYITDEMNRLRGVVSLRDLIISAPETKLEGIMNANVITVKDNDSFEELGELVTKYNLLALPVVDETDVLVGMAVLNDIIDEVQLPRKRKFA